MDSIRCFKEKRLVLVSHQLGPHIRVFRTGSTNKAILPPTGLRLGRRANFENRETQLFENCFEKLGHSAASVLFLGICLWCSGTKNTDF
ncbi:hypothetical protein EBR96_08655 [bacterium]|nr:hypothetical protein [bacterium]